MSSQNRGQPDIASLLLKGTRLQGEGRFLEAAEVFKTVIDHLKRLSMAEKDISRFIGNLAVCYWKAGKLDKALETYEEAKNIRKRNHEIGLYALATMNMGEIYGQKGQYTKALSLLEEGLRVAKDGAEPNYINVGYQQLMEILSRTGNIYQAIKIGLKPLKYYAELDRSKAFLDWMIRVVQQLRFINAFDVALKILDKGIEVTQNTNDIHFRNLLILEKAKIYQDSFQYDIAEKLMNEALENFKNLNDPEGIGKVLYDTAFLYDDMGNILKVLKIAEAQKHYESIGHKEMAKRCLDIGGEWMFGTILNKNPFNKEDEKSKPQILSKDKRENIVDKISQDNGKIRLDTEITEITTMFDCIISMDLSENLPLVSFGPVNKSFKIWDFKSKRAVLDRKPGLHLYDVLVKFVPNSNEIIAVSNITNPINIHDSSIFIIVQRFFFTETLDNKYKIVNETFNRLKVPDEETSLDQISDDGKYIYGRLNSLIRVGKDSKLQTYLHKIFIWETETGSLFKTYQFRDSDIMTKFISINYEQNQIFFLNKDLNFEIRNIVNNNQIKEIKPHCIAFSSFCVDKNFNTIAYETKTGDYEIWDIDKSELVSKINLEGELVAEIDIEIWEKGSDSMIDTVDCILSENGNYLAFYGADDYFYVYSISEKQIVKKFLFPDKSIVFLKFSKKNNKLLIATYKKESYILNLDE